VIAQKIQNFQKFHRGPNEKIQILKSENFRNYLRIQEKLLKSEAKFQKGLNSSFPKTIGVNVDDAQIGKLDCYGE